jgi:hypothetical protein
MVGDLKALEEIQNDHADEFAADGVDKLLKSYASALRGEAPNVSTYVPMAKDRTDFGIWQWVLLQAQADLLNGTTLCRSQFANWAESFAHDRLGWFLLDRYERIQPSPDGAAFYEALEWLYGNDPWVVQAVREARARNVALSAGDVEKVVAELSGFSDVRWPKTELISRIRPSIPSCWRVAAVVHQLLPKDPEKAHKIACQYYGAIINSELPGPRYFANHLIHLVEQANH